MPLVGEEGEEEEEEDFQEEQEGPKPQGPLPCQMSLPPQGGLFSHFLLDCVIEPELPMAGA